jgi:hypothetical protein
MDFLRFQNQWKSWRTRLYTRLLQGSLGDMGKGSFIAPPLSQQQL